MTPSNTSRAEILKKIETTRKRRPDGFYPVFASSGNEIYKPVLPDAVTCFKKELEAVKGKCVLCEDENDMYHKVKDCLVERAFPYLFCRDKAILFHLKENCIPYSGHPADFETMQYLFCRDKAILFHLKENCIPYSGHPADFETMQAGITSCEYLIARTGSVMVSSVSSFGRQMHAFPPVHIVVAKSTQLTNYYEDALIAMQQKYKGYLPSAITTITGPSRTADIEKTLVLGAHGPRELIVFISKK